MGQRADAVAARRLCVGGNARLHDDRVRQVTPAADEILAVAGISGRSLAAGEEVSERVELGPDPDDAAIAAAEDDVLGPVQVRQVVDGVGKAELDVAERAQLARRGTRVANLHDPQLARGRLVDRAERHEVQDLGRDSFERARDAGVGRAVPALVRVEFDPGWPGRRAPELARLLVAQVHVPAGLVDRDGVVAVAADAPVARVAIE